MKAILLTKPGEFEVIQKDEPGKPASGEVRLKIKSLAICGTDLHAFAGNQPFFSYPRILGHELAAEVVETGSGVNHLKPGDLCAVEPYRNAVVDQAVKRGRTTCGSKLTVLGVHEDGGLQEYINYPADRVHQTNGLHVDQITVIEPLAIGSRAVERADVTPKDIVLVVGVGPIGIAVIMMARLKGARIIALDTNIDRLGYVKQKFPETEQIVLSERVVDDISELLAGDLPTIVIDATGNKTSMLHSFEYVAAGGTIVFVGLFQGDVVFNDPSFHRKELTLKASRAATGDDFRKIIRLMKAGLIDIEGYITHRIAFDAFIESFPKLLLPEEKLIKAIVDY